MKLQATVGRILLSVVCVAAFATLAEAQATRTWVSGVGDDVNPCSRTAPCKTFAGAISKTATNGVISVLDPGGFGAVTITKGITIDGGGIRGSILAAGVNGIIINASGPAPNNPNRVIIRNIDIDGASSGFDGIRVLGSNIVVEVENVNITNMRGSNGDGIEVFATADAQLFVRNVSIRNVIGSGINVQNTRATINGLSVEASAKGVLGGVGANITIRDSVVSANGEGFASIQPSAVFRIENSFAVHNQFGVSASGGSTFELSNCGIFANSNTGLFNSASTINSLGGNSIRGNPTPGVFSGTFPPQ